MAKVQRIASLVLAALLAVPCLAGGSALAQASGEPIEITVMTDALSGPMAEYYETLNDRFREAHPGTNIVIKHEAMSFNDLQGAPLQVRYASGMAPDVQLLTVEMTLTLVGAGYLQELDRFYTEEVRADYFDGIVEGVSTFNGHVYTFMMHRGLEALFYDNKVLQEAGVAVPGTPEELIEAATKLTTDDRYGFTAFVDPVDHLIMTFIPFVWGEGGDVVNESLTEATIDSPEVIRGLDHIRKLMESGAMNPKPTRAGNDRGILGDGETVFQLLPFANSRTLAVQYPDRIADLGAARYPMPEGAKFITFGGGWAVAASAQSKHPEEAAQVAYWMAVEDNTTVKMMIQNSGNMPCRRSLLNDPEVQAVYNNQLYQAILSDEGHLNGVRMAYVAPSEFNKILIDMIDRTLYELETPVETIAAQQNEKMNQFLSTYTGPREGLRRQSFAFKNNQ